MTTEPTATADLEAQKEWCFVWPSADDVADMIDALRERAALVEAGWTLQELEMLDRLVDE